MADDPPDPRFRTIAAPPRIFPGRVSLAGLPRRQARSVRALLTAQLRTAALSACVSAAIDKGAGALRADGAADFARLNYRAGAACARRAARVALRLPSLARPVVAILRAAEARIDLRQARGIPAVRLRRAASAQLGQLARLIAIPPARLASLRRDRRDLLERLPRTVPRASTALWESAVLARASAPSLRAAAVLLGRAAAGR